MDILELLDHGYTWTSARIAAVSADDLDAPTPCGLWNLRTLLGHTVDTLTMLTAVLPRAAAEREAAEGRAGSPTSWPEAMAELAARSRQGWQDPTVMGRTFELPIGTMPGPVMASATLLETVVHGWDISQGTGELAQIPDDLALPVLEFARSAISDANRGNSFAADLGIGDTPSEQLVAYLGRKPR